MSALLLIALLGVEALVFYAHVVNFVTPFYPPRFDQLSYYLSTYDLLRSFHTNGFGAFVIELLQPGSATGSTFVLQGALLSLIGGENRTAFLSINLIYLFALQLILFGVVRSRTGRLDSAWVAVALLLSTSTLYQTAGGIYDYRIDFSALCLYGIWAGLVVWSGAFRYSGRTLLAAFAAILLIYSRFFTIIYVAGTLGALLAINVLAIWRSRSTETKNESIRRLRNILISGAIIAAVCLPRLYLSHDAIYGYYMIGHLLGDEKYIRAHELGLYSVAGHLLYYPKSIFETHFGVMAWLLAAALAAWSFLYDRSSIREGLARLRAFEQEFVALGVAILIPLAALTANISKSPVVGGVVTVPIVLAIVLFGAALWPRGATRRLSRSRWIGLAPVAMAVGLSIFVAKGLSTRGLPPAADLDRITLLAKWIATYAAENHLDRISVSTDRVVDYQNVIMPRLASVEILHRNLEVDGLLGHGTSGIFATAHDDAMRLIAASDVIVLTDPDIDRTQPYPINTRIKEYWGELWNWSSQNRRLAYSTEIFGIPYHVFVRPPVPSQPGPQTGSR
jgi:hypothetical protein